MTFPHIPGQARVSSELGAAPIELAALKWHLVETRSCLADFGQPCTSTVPAFQCPGTNPGTACTTYGDACHWVLGLTGYQLLSCD